MNFKIIQRQFFPLNIRPTLLLINIDYDCLYAEFALSEVVYEEGDNDEDLITGIDTLGHSIQLPHELLRLLNDTFGGSGSFIIASYLYGNMSGLLPGTLPERNKCVQTVAS